MKREGEIIGQSDDPKSTLRRNGSPTLVRILSSVSHFQDPKAFIKWHPGPYRFLTGLLVA